MAGTLKLISGPAFIANAAANIYTPAASTIYTVIRHIHVCNVTAGAVTFTLFIGATGASAAGTEIFDEKSVAAHDAFDYYCVTVMKSTDFLTGVASAATSLTIVVEGEQIVVP